MEASDPLVCGPPGLPPAPLLTGRWCSALLAPHQVYSLQRMAVDGEPPTSASPDGYVEDFKASINTGLPLPIAAVKTILNVIKRSQQATLMGLETEVKACAETLKEAERDMLGKRRSISLSAGIEIFTRYLTRRDQDAPSTFDRLQALFIERGERFLAQALKSRSRIADLGHDFIQDGMVVLTHGRSRVVAAVLQKAASSKNFSVLVTEGRPDGSGYEAAARCAQAGIPATVILDSAIGYVMERVDIVILGAEGVVESGGIVNKIGTFPLAMVAKAFNKPLYVAVESYKFARLYPLNQLDLPEGRSEQRPLPPCSPEATLAPGVDTENPACDYTPANYITLLFTDLGILTPAAVSDELITLYS